MKPSFYLLAPSLLASTGAALIGRQAKQCNSTARNCEWAQGGDGGKDNGGEWRVLQSGTVGGVVEVQGMDTCAAPR